MLESINDFMFPPNNPACKGLTDCVRINTFSHKIRIQEIIDTPRDHYCIFKPNSHPVHVNGCHFNILCAVFFFKENINIYLHFMSLIHIDITQVVENLPRVRQGPIYSTKSIYHGCWWPGDARSQFISNHDIYCMCWTGLIIRSPHVKG